MNHRDACSQVTVINDGLNSVQQIGVQDTSSEEFKSLQSKKFHLARRGGTASVMLNEGRDAIGEAQFPILVNLLTAAPAK
jgi:hypothetical protein